MDEEACEAVTSSTMSFDHGRTYEGRTHERVLSSPSLFHPYSMASIAARRLRTNRFFCTGISHTVTWSFYTIVGSCITHVKDTFSALELPKVCSQQYCTWHTRFVSNIKSFLSSLHWSTITSKHCAEIGSNRSQSICEEDFSLAQVERPHLSIACLLNLRALRQWTTIVYYCKICVVHKLIKSKPNLSLQFVMYKVP
jgi:hypothetical protein